MNFKSWFLSGCALAVAGGCAQTTSSTSSESNVRRVQSESQARLGATVSWNTSSEADSKAQMAVDRVLSSTLTVDAAVQIALLNNPSLQAQFEDIGIAQADLVQAGLLKNPMFDGAYEFAAGGGPAKINLSVTEDFLSLLAIPLRKKMAARTLDAATDRVGANVIELAASTRKAFVELQAAEQLKELRDTALKAANAAATVAHQLHDAGNINDLDLDTEEAESGEAVVACSTANADIADKRAALNEWMGLIGERAERWTIANHLADPPAMSTTQPSVEALTDRADTERLDVQAARHDVEAEAQGLGVAKQFAFLDGASVGASAEREHDRTWETGPAISVPIPLFDTGNAQVAAAAARWRQAKRRYQALIGQVRDQVRQAVNHLALASASATYLHDTEMPLRHRIVHQTLLQYNGMAMSVFQLLAARSAEVDAGRRYVEALRDYWVARAELDRAVGSDVLSERK